MKNNDKCWWLFVALLFASQAILGQDILMERSVLSNNGRSGQTEAVVLDYTLGQIVTSNGTIGQTLITGGFHQQSKLTTSIADKHLLHAEIKLFPNPATSKITLVIQQNGRYTLKWYDAMGQFLFAKNVDGFVDVSTYISKYSAGQYFVEVINAQGKRQVVSFTKMN